jgi:hypothetical protein
METREPEISVPEMDLTHLLLRCGSVRSETLPDRLWLAMIDPTPLQLLLGRFVPADVVNDVMRYGGWCSRLVVAFPPVGNRLFGEGYGVGNLVTVVPVSAGDVVPLEDADVVKVVRIRECLVAQQAPRSISVNLRDGLTRPLRL